MKILNLYAGIGGNRKLWGDEHEITAIELDPEIAEIYRKNFPKDRVIIADAHHYLLNHFKEFDFIWSSPPCPTHSRTNTFLLAQGIIRYPDMSLWQEIIFLKKWFRGLWVVENVISYYPPLIKPILLDRHYFWSSFHIDNFVSQRKFNIANANTTTRRPSKDHLLSLEEYHGFKINSKNKRLLLRNCVYPPLALHILKNALKSQQTTLSTALQVQGEAEDKS